MTNNLRKKTQSSRTMPFQLLTLILKCLLNPQHNNYYVRTSFIISSILLPLLLLLLEH